MKKSLFILLAVMAAGCTKPEEKIKNYLTNGKELYQHGDYNKAKIEFKNVIQLDSKNADAFYHLALIDEKNKNWQGMYGNLTQVSRLDPKNNEAHLKLARLTLLAGQLDETLQHVEAILKNAPDNSDALALKGAVLVKKNNYDEAMALANQVLAKQPDHADATSLKTIIYIAKKEFDQAYKTVEQALQKKPNDLALLQLKLQIHSQNKDLAAVERDILDLIKQYPDNLQYAYTLAKHYAGSGQDEKAVSTLESVVAKHPNDVQPKLVLVDYYTQKAPELVEKKITEFLGQHPNAAELYFRQAGLYIKQNKIADAKQTLSKISELKADSKDSLKAKMMLGRIAFQENDVETAKSLIKEVMEKDKHNLDAYLLKAKMDLNSGANDDVISNLRGVLRDFANSDEAYVLLGQAYLRKNSPQLAEENFRKALAINPANFDALLPVVSTMMKNRDNTRAEELLQKALKAAPNNVVALQTLAQVKLYQKDWNGAQKIADDIAEDPQTKGFGKFLSGRIAEQRGLCKEAIGLYKESLALAPESSDALRNLAGCYANLKQDSALIPFLNDFIAAHPDNGYAVLLKGQLLAGAKKYSEALALLEKATEKWPNATELYETIAMIHLQNKENEKAISALNKGIENKADPAKINLVLASTYEQTGSYEKALTLYNDLIAKYPDLDVAVNNTVSLLLDRFNNKENVNRAVSLAKRFEKSEQPYFLDSYGWALFHSGRHEEALQIFKNVVSKMPDTPVFRYHLGAAYQKTGNNADAARELKKALELGVKADNFADKEAAEKLLSSLK